MTIKREVPTCFKMLKKLINLEKVQKSSAKISRTQQLRFRVTLKLKTYTGEPFTSLLFQLPTIYLMKSPKQSM